MKETKFFKHAKVLWSVPQISFYKSTPAPKLAATRFCAKYANDVGLLENCVEDSGVNLV